MNGRVKFFSKEKGFGFIIGSDSQDYFFHVSEVRDMRLAEVGDDVEYIASKNKKGKCALSIKVTQKADNSKVVRVIHENPLERQKYNERMEEKRSWRVHYVAAPDGSDLPAGESLARGIK